MIFLNYFVQNLQQLRAQHTHLLFFYSVTKEREWKLSTTLWHVFFAEPESYCANALHLNC